MRRISAILVVLLLAACGARAAEPSACDSLARMAGATGPGFVASYPTVGQGPLKDAAYLYDIDVAVVALVGCGRRDLAVRLGEAILWAQDHDRFWHDGRLRNAYLAGRPAETPVKLPGWWDPVLGRWLEDRYQVGSDSGNMAWTILALLALDATRDGGADGRFLAAAKRLGGWMTQWLDPAPPAGFVGATLGHEPDPLVRRWKSTEQNTDLFAAFSLLAGRDADPRWRRLAAVAHDFVAAMWQPACGCFAAGTGDDGHTLNPTLALDAQVWPPTAMPDLRRDGLWPMLEAQFAVRGGYAYGAVRDGVWTEGTAQAALLAQISGQAERASALRAVIRRQRAGDGGYYATDAGALPTGFALESDPSQPRLYFHLPHLGATAWAALAESGFNPFSLTR